MTTYYSTDGKGTVLCSQCKRPDAPNRYLLAAFTLPVLPLPLLWLGSGWGYVAVGLAIVLMFVPIVWSAAKGYCGGHYDW